MISASETVVDREAGHGLEAGAAVVPATGVEEVGGLQGDQGC